MSRLTKTEHSTETNGTNGTPSALLDLIHGKNRSPKKVTSADDADIQFSMLPPSKPPILGIRVTGDEPEKHGFKTRIVVITPELAEAWIKHLSPEQRQVKSMHLASLVRDIKRGRWKLNGETIVIDRHGRCVQGQHRLLAVIKAGMPISSFVVFGMTDDVFSTFDIVAKRQGADTLRVRGVKDCVTASAIVRLLLVYENSPAFSTNIATSPVEVDEVWAANDDLPEAVLWAGRVKAVNSALKGSVAGACYFLFSRKDKEAADTFFEDLVSGANLAANDPVKTLRDRVLRRDCKLSHREQIAVIIKAWNCRREGKSVEKIYWNSERESFPVIRD